MKCIVCQIENAVTAKFCRGCGSALSSVLPEAGGVAASKSCPHCASGLKQEAKFCGKCGFSFMPPPEAVVAPPVQPQPVVSVSPVRVSLQQGMAETVEVQQKAPDVAAPVSLRRENSKLFWGATIAALVLLMGVGAAYWKNSGKSVEPAAVPVVVINNDHPSTSAVTVVPSQSETHHAEKVVPEMKAESKPPVPVRTKVEQPPRHQGGGAVPADNAMHYTVRRAVPEEKALDAQNVRSSNEASESVRTVYTK